MTCETGPFALSEASENVQNLGCLPTPGEIMTWKRDLDLNWHCHGDLSETRPCAGFVQQCQELGFDFKVGDMASYTNWYETGNARRVI